MIINTSVLRFIPHVIFGALCSIWCYALYMMLTMHDVHYALIVFCGFAYLIGSIPAGVIIARLMNLGDLRTIGSGNIGATNVLRTGNKKAALYTLFFDMIKGTIAVKFYHLLPYSSFTSYSHKLEWGIILGAFAFIGHIFPVFLKFRGGKGVATYLGTLLGLSSLWWFSGMVIWIGGSYISKISSVGALTMAVLMPILIYFVSNDYEMVFWVLSLMSFLLILKHGANIFRLWQGTEGKISFLDKK